MRPYLLFCCVLAAGTLTGADKVIPKDTEFRVQLLGPVDTATNKQRDKITAQVTAPREFAGDIMEGVVRASKGGKKVRGTAVLALSFEMLHHGESNVAVQAEVKSLVNSKGQQNVDEEGRVIKKKNQLGKAAVGAGIGAIIGGLAAGAGGAAIGAAAGGAATIMVVQMGTQGAQISFAPGSEFVLSVKQRK